MDVTYADTDLERLYQRFPELMNVLDEKSKALFWHIWRNRHAQIRELSNLIKAPSDLYTLSRLKDVINVQAQKILGRKIVTFKESNVDPVTGEKVLFSWWIDESYSNRLEQNNEFVDIFDENKKIRVVMKLPPRNGQEVNVNVKQDILVIFTDTYQKKIPLLYHVKENITKTYTHGILEVCLEKV